MGVEAVSVGLVGLALELLGMGVVFAGLAIVAARRFGPRGGLLLWLVVACIGAAGVTIRASGFLQPGGMELLSFFLVPFLFLFIQLGLVTLYVHRSVRRGTDAAWQFLFALLIFFVAIVPAAAVAVIPDITQFMALGRT